MRLKNRAKSRANITVKPHIPPMGTYALYHLANDPGERNDLSAKHPAELKRLQEMMKELPTDGRSRPYPPARSSK